MLQEESASPVKASSPPGTTPTEAGPAPPGAEVANGNGGAASSQFASPLLQKMLGSRMKNREDGAESSEESGKEDDRSDRSSEKAPAPAVTAAPADEVDEEHSSRSTDSHDEVQEIKRLVDYTSSSQWSS